LNNREKLSGNTQKGIACATLLCTIPKIKLTLFKKWSISVTSEDGRILE
jgi:hypothetical protein